MAATHRHVIAVSTVLLLIFAMGVFYLIRLGMGAPSNGDIPPVASSPDTAPHTSDSDPTPTDTGTASAPSDEPGREPADPGREDSGRTTTDNTRTTDPGTQPPRPAVRMSSVGGIGPRVLIRATDGFRVQFNVNQAFSVPVTVVDVNIIQPKDELVIDAPAGEDVTKCRRGTIERGETGPLCTVNVSVSESAAPGHYKGQLELIVGATCTSKTGRPCQDLPEHYAPSPDNPIDVTWNYYVAVSAWKSDVHGSSSPTAGPTS